MGAGNGSWQPAAWIVTPSHNAPRDGAFKYNPADGAGRHRLHNCNEAQFVPPILHFMMQLVQ